MTEQWKDKIHDLDVKVAVMQNDINYIKDAVSKYIVPKERKLTIKLFGLGALFSLIWSFIKGTH